MEYAGYIVTKNNDTFCCDLNTVFIKFRAYMLVNNGLVGLKMHTHAASSYPHYSLLLNLM